MLCMQAARRAKAAGSTRFCMGAAWRGPSQVGKGQWARVLGMVKEIRGMGMEVCTTLGMLTPEQARMRPIKVLHGISLMHGRGGLHHAGHADARTGAHAAYLGAPCYQSYAWAWGSAPRRAC